MDAYTRMKVEMAAVLKDADELDITDWLDRGVPLNAVANCYAKCQVEKAAAAALMQKERELAPLAPDLAAAEAKGKAEGFEVAQASAHAYAYVLYATQRRRIMQRSYGSCRNCRAWEQTHLQDYGF
jgi:hypothetical protein